MIFKVEEKTNSRLDTVRLRRQKLMDAFEEAKHEHFESIRINIGHPSYYDALQDLTAREATRRVRFAPNIHTPSAKTNIFSEKTFESNQRTR